jgi:hypothetical protein
MIKVANLAENKITERKWDNIKDIEDYGKFKIKGMDIYVKYSEIDNMSAEELYKKLITLIADNIEPKGDEKIPST